MMNVFKKLLVVGFLALSVQSGISAWGRDHYNLQDIVKFAEEISKDSSFAEKAKVSEWLYSLVRKEGVYVDHTHWSNECLIAVAIMESELNLDEKVERLSQIMHDAKKAQWNHVINEAKRRLMAELPHVACVTVWASGFLATIVALNYAGLIK